MWLVSLPRGEVNSMSWYHVSIMLLCRISLVRTVSVIDSHVIEVSMDSYVSEIVCDRRSRSHLPSTCTHARACARAHTHTHTQLYLVNL